MKSGEVTFSAVIEKYGSNGDKSGWTYLLFSTALASQLHPGNRKSFRIKGYLDKHKISRVALIPVGDGCFILPFNAAMRKATGKNRGDKVIVKAIIDKSTMPIDKDLMECLKDEPTALKNFMTYSPSHRSYYSKWIESAKTESTKTKRITLTIDALLRGWDYGQMLRAAGGKKS